MTLLGELWSILTPLQRRWVLCAQALSIVMAFSTVAGIASIAPFFGVLGNPQSIDDNARLHWLYVHLGFADKHHFEAALGFGFMAAVFAANLINVVGAFAMVRISWRVGTDMQSALFGEYLHRPYEFHTATHGAVLFNNIIHETSRTTNDILQNVFVLVTNTATAAFIVLSVMLLNPAVAAAMIAALAGGYAAIYLTVRNRLLRAGEVQSTFFVEQTKIVQESLGAIKEIIVLRMQEFFRTRFRLAGTAYARAAGRTQVIGQTPRHIMECVAVAGLVCIALLAGNREGGIGPRLGELTFLAFAAYRLLPTLQQAFAALVKIRAGRAGLNAVAADLRLARSAAPRARAAASLWGGRPHREIRLADVSFAYPSRESGVLKDVSIHIPRGIVVGLVGANGSGKTTLADLIAGLLVPAAGHLEVDGILIDRSNRADWQSRIAYVPQNIFLLDTSISQNVALGVAPADIDRLRLAEAVRLARLDEVAGLLPDGLNHRVGERGIRMSGGQRQRIGIARALYTDASVLILDEATSSMDGLTERELMATLLNLRGRYTIFLVAHRSDSMRACDSILEFDQGRITQTAAETYFSAAGGASAKRRLGAAT